MNAFVTRLAKNKRLADLMFSIVLLGLHWMLGRTARKYPFFKERIQEKDLVVQIRLKDGSRGRHYALKGGEYLPGKAFTPNPTSRYSSPLPGLPFPCSSLHGINSP